MSKKLGEYKYDPLQVEIDGHLRQLKESFPLELESILGKPGEDIGETDINDLVGLVAGQDRESDFSFMVGGLATLYYYKHEHERI